jgi:hypothetical protein
MFEKCPLQSAAQSDSALVKDQGIFYARTRGEFTRRSGRG